MLDEHRDGPRQVSTRWGNSVAPSRAAAARMLSAERSMLFSRNAAVCSLAFSRCTQAQLPFSRPRSKRSARNDVERCVQARAAPATPKVYRKARQPLRRARVRVRDGRVALPRTPGAAGTARCGWRAGRTARRTGHVTHASRTLLAAFGGPCGPSNTISDTYSAAPTTAPSGSITSKSNSLPFSATSSNATLPRGSSPRRRRSASGASTRRAMVRFIGRAPSVGS